MKYCNTCKISYKAPLDNCMICNDTLEKVSEEQISNYPVFKEQSRFTKYFVRGAIFLNLITIILSLSIEFLLKKTFSWSLIVSISSIYLILVIKILLDKNKFAIRLFWLIIISILEIIGIAFLTKDYHWAIDIVLPHSLMLNTIILIAFTLAKRKRWQDYTMFLLISVISNVVIIIFPLLGLTKQNWAIVTSFFLGIFTFLAFLIFTPKDIKEEFLRRFHT